MRAGDYDKSPWTGLYPRGLPTHITPAFDNMLDAFKASLKRAPDAPALFYFDGVITFAELHKNSSALALALMDRGFSRGDRLGLYTQNNPAFVIGLLAAWKAGGFAVAINPMNRARELTYVLQNSGAKALLCLDVLYEDVARTVIANEAKAVTTVVTFSALDGQTQDDTRVLSVDTRLSGTVGVLKLQDILAQHSDVDRLPQTKLEAHDVALLTYTSGTTGNPKGVMNTQGNMAFNAQTYRDWVGLTPEDRILGMAPLFHITGSLAHIALAFLTACPVILTHRFHSDVMLDCIRTYKPTFTIGAITAFISLMHNPKAQKSDFSSFRVMLSGGAPISPATSASFEAFSGHYLYNAFGMTETCSPTHLVPLGKRAPVDPHSGALSIGIPVFNTKVCLVGDDGEPVSIGAQGELLAQGPQVMGGYWNMPEATQAAMQGGWLHTGDVCVMDEHGWFYLVDRKKDMINAAGYKVWPREVEDVLYAHPGIREAAVVGIPDAYRGETVKAVVSLKAGTTTNPEELIEHCKANMAAYKVPRILEIVDDLPKTVTGKILRRSLRENLEVQQPGLCHATA